MTSRTFEAIHEDTINKVAALKEHLEPDDRLDRERMLEELTTTVEELSVVMEELAQQNCQLLATQEKLGEQEARYKSLFQSAPTAYIITDRQAVIKEANQAAGELLKVNANKLKGKPFSIYVCKDQRREFFAVIEEIGNIQKGESLNWKFDVLPRSAEPIPALAIICTHKDNAAKHDQLRFIIQDLSASKRLDDYLVRFELYQEFVAALMHDLKVPITGSKRVLERLTNGSLGEMSKNHKSLLLEVNSSNQQILHSIDSLLEAYNLSSKTPAEHFRDCDKLKKISPALIVKDCIEAINPAALARNISLNCKISKRLPDFSANKTDLRRLILCLLDNGLKYSAKGSCVDIIVSKKKGNLQIEIADNGPGISIEDQKNIFDRFWRGGDGHAYPSGSGLGLFLCKKIVTLYGGEIICKSEVGSGCLFIAKLPYKSQD